MKINYRKNGTGNRTTMTVSDVVYDAWCNTLKPDYFQAGTYEQALRELIEGIDFKPSNGKTFVSLVEAQMLADIVGYVKSLEHTISNLEFDLEMEQDGK